jgi:hypothetical protein
MMVTSQAAPPSALGNTLRHIQEVVYFPWKLAYTRTWLHQPLGMYMHFWCPRHFDQKGDVLRP